jgi:hypothetical protein
MALGKLKKYVDAYNIKIDRAVEKDDVIDGILAARVGVVTPCMIECEWLSRTRE